MNAFVEHVDAEQKLQMIAGISLEGCEGLAGFRIIGIGGIDMRCSIYFGKPLGDLPDHFLHVFPVGAENDVFAGVTGHVFGEHFIQTICHVQGPAKGLQVFFRSIPDRFAPGAADFSLVLLQILLIGKHRQHIFGRVQNTPDNCLTQGHFRRYIPVKQLIGHVPLIVQIADCRGRKA